jgi:hypothetical protein
MNFVFSLFFYLIYPSPELIKDHYFTFSHKEMFYIIEKDSIYQTLDGREFKSWSHENSFDHFNFGFLNANDQTYLISNGGGVVYLFEEMSLKRIDNSFEHKNKYFSYDFILGSKVYSFGGYGLLDDNNLISQFDLNFKEWSEHLTQGTKPPKQRYSIGQVIDSVLYVGGGISKHIDKDFNLTTTNQNNFWQHDFRNKSWNYIGKANNLFSKLMNKFYNKHRIKFNENTLVITQDEVFELDIKNNKLIIYNDINENLLFNLDQILYDPDKDLFMLTKLNDEKGSLDLFFLHREKLLGNDTMSHKLYSSKWTFSYYLFPFMLLVFTLFVVKRRTKKDALSVIKKNMSNIKNELSGHEYFILETLMNHHPKPVQFPSLLSKYEPNLSYESRVKKLRLAMSNLDEVIYKHTKRKALIFSRNKNDKRIKQVSIINYSKI